MGIDGQANRRWTPTTRWVHCGTGSEASSLKTRAAPRETS